MYLERIQKDPIVPAKPTEILLVHGFWHSAWSWDEGFMDLFAGNGYRVHAFSLRGHGKSEGWENLNWWSVNDFVSDIVGIFDTFETQPIVIGGSAGGFYVQKFLELRKPPAAVIIGSVPSSGVFGISMRVMLRHPWTFMKVILTLNTKNVIATKDLCRECLYSDALSEDKFLEYYEKTQKESFRAYFDMMFLSLPKVQKINTPILVIGSDADQIVSVSETKKTAHDLNAELKLYSGIGHMMVLDHGWEIFANDIISWLSDQGL